MIPAEQHALNVHQRLSHPDLQATSGLLTQVIEDFGDSSHLNMTTTFQQFDAAGNPQQIITPRGEVLTYQYDNKNRVTRVENNLGFVTTLVYDRKGNITYIVESNPTSGRDCRIRLRYNPEDQLTQATIIAGTTFYQVNNSYDVNQKLATQSDNRGASLTVGYDAADQLITVTDALNQTTLFSYSVRGGLATQTYPDGRVVSFNYDKRIQPTSKGFA